jgi:hypothetical protein
MSEREPTYLMLDENEDFSLQAHVDSDGQQRIVVTGYLVRRKADGVYQAPLIPQLFFGASGQQLETWSQYLTAGDHTILRRDSGNPRVPDHELFWRKVSEAPRRPQAPPSRPPPTTVTMEIPLFPILVVIGVPIAIYAFYKLLGRIK